MARRLEITAVGLAAVIQGIVLVTFPAVSAIFTSVSHYGLSATEYGGMFVPQAVTAILASLLGAGLTHLIGGKQVFLLGLAADLLSMVLLFGSQFTMNDHALAFVILLAATASLGIGFGFAVPALNTFTAAFFPNSVDRALLALNALLGLGTALAPVLAILFVGQGIWWGLPALMSALTLALLVFSLTLPLRVESETSSATKLAGSPSEGIGMPARFWIFASFALLYGICETLNANWAPVYLATNLGSTPTLASMALTLFWGAVTGGRILFAVIEKWCPSHWTFRLLPVVVAFAFLATAFVPKNQPALAILAFGLAGLGCSALLPLVISFGQRELTTMRASVAGGLIGFYQMGYGIAAFGVGPLQAGLKLNLGSIYGWTSLGAIALTTLAYFISQSPQADPDTVARA